MDTVKIRSARGAIVAAGMFASLVGCGASDWDMDYGDDDDFHETGLIDDFTVRIDVLPTTLLDSDGGFRVLPRTQEPFELWQDHDAGLITLYRPALIGGEVIGAFVTPFASGGQLPTITGPVSAEVSLRKADSVQRYVTTTDADGLFSTMVVPFDDYELIVVPDDPNLPLVIERLTLGEQPPFQDIYVDYGVPIWGSVSDSLGNPLSGVAVHARTEGARTADAITDAQGRYLLRVPPQRPFEVVSTGRASGRDPQLTAPQVIVGEEGAQVDFVYSDLSPIWRGGTVLSTDSRPLGGVKVRFVSKSLDGYPDGRARVSVETVTPADGNFDVRLIAGTYQVEFWPPAGEDPGLGQSPLLMGEYVVEGGADIGSVVLPPMVQIASFVVDEFEDPVAEARINCRENSFGRREWSTYTNELGRFELSVPQTPLTCTQTPPGSRRLDLAVTRTLVDPRTYDGAELYFQRGLRITGLVEGPEGPEEAAVVEVRDAGGALIGSTLTGSDGGFELRVASPERR